MSRKWRLEEEEVVGSLDRVVQGVKASAESVLNLSSA